MKKYLTTFLTLLLCLQVQAFEPACLPSSCCGPSFSADVTYLYWQASMANLEYAALLQTLITPSGTPNPAIADMADLKNVNFGWDSGVSACLAYNSGYSSISLLLTGTYFHSTSRGQSSFTTINNDTMVFDQVPLVNPEFVGNIVQNASAKWVLDFGYLDLLAASSFIPAPNFNLMPNFGLRGVWIENHYTANYENGGFFHNASSLFSLSP